MPAVLSARRSGNDEVEDPQQAGTILLDPKTEVTDYPVCRAINVATHLPDLERGGYLHYPFEKWVPRDHVLDQHDTPVLLHHPRHFPERCLVIRHGAKDETAGNRIERIVRERRERLGIHLEQSYGEQTPLPISRSLRKHGRRNVDSCIGRDRRINLLQSTQGLARPDADVKDVASKLAHEPLAELSHHEVFAATFALVPMFSACIIDTGKSLDIVCHMVVPDPLDMFGHEVCLPSSGYDAYDGVYRPARRRSYVSGKASCMPPSGRSARSTRADASALISEMRSLSGSPDRQVDLAITAMSSSRHLDVQQVAIGIIGERRDPLYRPTLHQKYAWCETHGAKGDTSGYIREAIVKALQPIVSAEDTDLLHRALTTYQMDGDYEVCAGLRAAALIAMNDLDPDLAGLFAARLLTDPLNSFSGEPASTAIRVLAAQQNLAPVFGLVSWGTAQGEVIGEGLRHLVDLPASLLPLLANQYLKSEDEQVVLGLFDLLLGHPTRDEWSDTLLQFFRTTTLMDLYGIIAIQVVASRSGTLIESLRELATTEVDPLRRQLLDQALELA